MVDLNDLIPPGGGLTLVSGAGIDDQGRIAVGAIDSANRAHALLLSPTTQAVPEPTSLVVFCALASAGLLRRRISRGQ
jgi:hypothetical protein